MRYIRHVGSICYGISALVVGLEAHADTADNQQLQTVVVTATAIPGTSIDIDKIPGNVQILSADDLTREGSASLTSALSSNLSSVNINDDLDDPFQPDILYRGFEASPSWVLPRASPSIRTGFVSTRLSATPSTGTCSRTSPYSRWSS